MPNACNTGKGVWMTRPGKRVNAGTSRRTTSLHLPGNPRQVVQGDVAAAPNYAKSLATVTFECRG
jgi:hypothetical protein